MNASDFNLNLKRTELGDALENFNQLLNNLEIESENISGEYAMKIFQQRFAILTAIAQKIIEYDASVMTYVVNHPDGHNVKYYRDQLQVAKRYIEANGLDWSTVVWGKISDY